MTIPPAFTTRVVDHSANDRDTKGETAKAPAAPHPLDGRHPADRRDRSAQPPDNAGVHGVPEAARHRRPGVRCDRERHGGKPPRFTRRRSSSAVCPVTSSTSVTLRSRSSTTLLSNREMSRPRRRRARRHPGEVHFRQSRSRAPRNGTSSLPTWTCVREHPVTPLSGCEDDDLEQATDTGAA